ncbi:hypothetical protein LPB19_12455 [Marinobacter salinisoli]|uniref:Uncharacterized protein n=1 Tax=Marinobacter salinisoli TaxID=2769486 RepID=A0ABX7MNZ5_9GAMM|nr:hypothetical protein [Marinobacter salinisoli]QSP94000.1 hypothetical protein LPB19_12455 [Marinobacter salinisoli]
MAKEKYSPIAQAQQDWRNGLSIDENPFPPGSREFLEYHSEFDRLQIEEEKRALWDDW